MTGEGYSRSGIEVLPDDDGRFHFEGSIGLDFTLLRIEARHPSLVALRRGFLLEPGASNLDTGDLCLARGGHVRGQVLWAVAPSDRAAWYVLIFPEEASSPGSPGESLPRCEIDASGFFEAALVPAGVVSISLVHPLLGLVDQVHGTIENDGFLQPILESMGPDPSSCVVIAVESPTALGEVQVLVRLNDGSSVPAVRGGDGLFCFGPVDEPCRALITRGDGLSIEREGLAPGSLNKVALLPENEIDESESE